MSERRKIKDIIGKELLFFDGGMGSLLLKRGLQTGELPETWNLLHPEIVEDIHREYLESGSDFVTSNTFGANRFKYGNTEYDTAEIIKAGIRIAKEACRKEELRRANLVKAGNASFGPGFREHVYAVLDIGSSGKLLKPVGNVEFEDAVEVFAEIVKAGAEAGAEAVLIETFTDNYEMKAALLAAKENCDLPVFVTMVPDESGRLLTGGDIASACAMLEGLRVDAIGFNCGFGPEQILEFLPQLTKCCSVPILVQPNAGLPKVVNGETVYDVGPEAFAEKMQEIVQGGAHIVGGCCGTTPAHIAAEVKACRDIELQPVTDKGLTVVSSYSHAVYFGEKPLIIGERINPTGKKRFKQALRENDIDYIMTEAIHQEEAGADILDVNVGLPEIDEPKMMESVVSTLQGLLDLPLQIDTTDPVALEKALRIVNGKAMINSVNGHQEIMDAVFPIVKKYGGVLVCLCLDEDGIPTTAEGRANVAKKIIEKATAYGIPRKDLVVDTLVMTVSTDDRNGRVTLDALEMVRKGMKMHTVLGVSNVSFGLPQRNTITSTFFTLAMMKGLSAGIVNPMSDALMNAYYSYLTLMGLDPQCLKYIEKFSNAEETVVKTGGGASANAGAGAAEPAGTANGSVLYNAVLKGTASPAAKAAEEMLKTTDPLEIIDKELIPALDTVGKGFEAKKVFLPQLLMSAEAATAAFDMIRKHFEHSGAKSEPKGKIIMATVKGDIHDIGKNIVRVLLQNYDFDVYDLGKDVAPETIVETAIKENVRLIGLSALMTTTVVNMEETIKQLRESGHECRIMVGGAVLTQEYADMIGADFYSPDAMGSVRYACGLADEGWFK